MRNKTTTYKWAYLPFVFSSAAILATQATAGPAGQRYQDAKQVNSVNHEYVGGDHSIGFGVDDQGNVDVQFDGAISTSDEHRTGVGLWAGYDLKGDDQGVLGRGGQVNHAWVSKDASGRVTHVNKTFAAYDRNEAGHEKATVGYGQENERLFWDGRVSKGLSGNKNTVNGVSDRAYDWGVGATVGKFLPDANARIRAGIDHEWSNKVGRGEKNARNTTLSAGIEKFFQGTGHSLSLDVAGSDRSGGAGRDDNDVTGRIGYKYDFGGASIYQPDRRYRRVRVEVPGKAVPPRYAQKQQYKKVPTYKNVPVYGNKTVRVPTKQLVKSTMELEGQTFFKLNSAKLIPSAQTRLKQIAAQIRKTGYKGSIRITGNTCGLGDAKYDQILSERRAKEVRNFLIKNGFNPNHLIARGLGKGHPKYPRTPDQDFKNRRVDIEYVTQQERVKTGYRNETKRVQTGTRRVATGFKNVPAGMKNVMISNGRPGAPRVIWKTEAIPTSPAWIQRALNNGIKHNTSVNTYSTTYNNGDDFVRPEANNDTGITTEGTAVTLDVLNNDTSNSGSNQLTITSVGSPQNGTAQIVGGQIVYTPNAGFVGTDSFTYTITDSNGQTATATATVTVNPSDDVKAADDSARTNEGEPVAINVLTNDDADASITRITRGPSNGSVTIINGQIVYTPNAGFTGTDTFDYEVRDPQGNTTTATVTVTVDAVNNPAPVAQNDSATTPVGTAVTLPVLGNDTSNSGSGQLTITSVGNPQNGTAQIVNGQIVYTPNTGFSGTDSFVYTITDSNGETATATATVTVGGPKPVAQNDSATTPVGTAVTLPVLGNDTSNSGSGQLTITNVGNPQNGTARIVNGQIVYTPNAGFSGTDSFVYTITDSNGETATATARIVVGGDKPVATDDSATTTSGTAVTLPVLGNDTTNSGSGQLTITSVGNPQNGTARIVNGQIVYTPNANFAGTDSFSYTITDSNGETATATATITVKGKKPVAQNDSVTTAAGTAVTLPVLSNDRSLSGSGQLTITSVGNPQNGTAQIVNGQIVYTPNAGFSGSDSFTYTVTDSNGETATATATVTISAPKKPLAKNDSANTKEGEAVTLPVLSNDSSRSGSGQLTITSVGNPQNGTARIVNGQIVYTPSAGFAGTDRFTYTITDSNGETATATATVSVEANKAPDAKNDAVSTMCTAITIDALANDTDADGDNLSIVGISAANLKFGSVTQRGSQIIYQPSSTCGKGNTGVDNFSYTISDGNGNTDSANVKVTVKAPAAGNTKAVADDALINAGQKVTINVLANDSGKGIKVISVDEPKNGHATFTASKVIYTPKAGFTGTDMFYYDIVDANGYHDSAMIIVDVVKGCAVGHKCN